MDISATVKSLVLKLFPELSAGYHLPRFAEVVAVRETPDHGDVCDEFRPRYAVDVQILDEHGEFDPSFPLLNDVILAVPVAGHEMGFFAYPENGTWVEIAFAYGSPNRPFIRSVLPHRLTLPQVERGEQRWQHNPESFMRMDNDGNHEHITDLDLHQKSLTRLIEAMDVVEDFHRSVKNTKTNDTEIIGAIKRINAFGAVVVQAGGVLDLSSVDHLRLTTKANAIIRAMGDLSVTIDGASTTNVVGDIYTTTPSKQLLKAPKTWVGSSSENALRLMSETAQLVVDLADILATHTHPSTGTISQGGAVTAISGQVGSLKLRIDGIAE
tara:strand:+ start:100683 stop:101660 length:978 start_codon:yes stop_codon:yes gene_type:complete